jgi:carboxypeptidase Q
MDTFGLDRVWLQPVMVPHWERGAESAEVVAPHRLALAMAGLGDSVGTPPGGLEGEAIVVGSFDELLRQAANLKGRIVVSTCRSGPIARRSPPTSMPCSTA